MKYLYPCGNQLARQVSNCGGITSDMILLHAEYHSIRVSFKRKEEFKYAKNSGSLVKVSHSMLGTAVQKALISTCIHLFFFKHVLFSFAINHMG